MARIFEHRIFLRCDELSAALHTVSGEMERRSEEKDHIIEMLQSQHTYLTQTILQNENHVKELKGTPIVAFELTESETVTEPWELQDSSKRG